MSMWSSNPASVAATQRAAAQPAALEGSKPVILYPNKSGVTTSGNGANYVDPVKQARSNDPYGGSPISLNINTSDSSAKAIQSLQGTLGSAVTGVGNSLAGLQNGISSLSSGLGSLGNVINQGLSGGFKGLMDTITKQSADNNAWSAKQAQKQMDYQTAMQQQAMEYNSLEAAKNRDWQFAMSSTAHQREVADLKAAGLNPVLSASGGNGAAVTSGATAFGAGVPSGAKGDTDESSNAALASLFGAILSAQTSMHNTDVSAKANMAIADRQAAVQLAGQELAARASMTNAQLAAEANRYGADASMHNADVSSAATRYAAGTNYAASVYGSDQNLLNQREQRQWNADHPSNLYQTFTSNPAMDTLGYLAQKARGFFSGSSTTSAKSKSSHSHSGKF